MARFRAYVSDSEDESDVSMEAPPPKPQKPAAEVRGGDSSMDEDEVRVVARPNRASAREPSDVEEEEEDEEDEDEESEEEVDEELDEGESEDDARGRTVAHPKSSVRALRGPAGDPTIIPWAREIGVDPQKMHVMQTSLFRMPEEEKALKALNQPQPRRKLLLTGGHNLSRKHSRDSDGEGIRADSRQRASFAHDIEPEPYRPSRKYARVDTSASAFAGHEHAYIDAGLAFGRSFRVGWGPGGTLVHLGDLCGPTGTPKSSANASVIKLSTVPLISGAAPDASALASRLLSHHLSNTLIEEDADGIPFANPSARLTFASFVSQFPSTDQSFEPALFRLGHALFDPIDFRLDDIPDVHVRHRIRAIRRKTELSKWLKAAVSSAMDADLRDQLDTKWDRTVFTHLSGYQVERACEAAAEGGNVKLASLIAQCPGDGEFRADLQDQLEIWRQERIDAHISEDTRKIYALLAGVADTLKGSGGSGIEHSGDLDLARGLDWKRAFGLQLWYGLPMDAPIAEVFDAYDALWKEGLSNVASPVPWYAERTDLADSAWKLPPKAQHPDALYSLIRLFADPGCNLSTVLSSFSFSPSPADYRLPWHLYILLSRCLRVRDLADRDTSVRQRSPDVDDGVEGHSPSADLLANSYASQLEQLGMIQEAVFVLLHVEGSAGRAKVIKELLTRSAAKLDDWVTRGLVGSLKIPVAWINEAKAVHALDSGKLYEAYELYLSAGLYDAAHDIAVLELAPDAVIRQDLVLLRELFDVFDGRPVSGWNDRGKVFLDYAQALTRLPQLRERLVQGDGTVDEDETAELDQLSRSVPKLVSVIPDVLPDRSNVRHTAAAAEMTNQLVRHLDQIRPLAIAQAQLRTPFFGDATRVRNIHSTMYERFLRTVEVA
ncbi:nuclear protein 96-domain-containing protein [Trametes polyzona]|nr:nuclear protein 96-domain-containing protein [Trametes polyzona]